MQCRLRSLVLGLAAFAASTVIAADHPLAGDSLLLKDPVGKPEKRSVLFRATRDLAIDPTLAGDPRRLGATLNLTSGGGGDGASGPIVLPPGSWKGLGNPPGSKGYKFLDKNRTNGIKDVNFKTGNKGGALHLDAASGACDRSLCLAIGPHPPLCLRVANGSTGTNVRV
jgi:hypothetical protein